MHTVHAQGKLLPHSATLHSAILHQASTARESQLAEGRHLRAHEPIPDDRGTVVAENRRVVVVVCQCAAEQRDE